MRASFVNNFTDNIGSKGIFLKRVSQDSPYYFIEAVVDGMRRRLQNTDEIRSGGSEIRTSFESAVTNTTDYCQFAFKKNTTDNTL